MAVHIPGLVSVVVFYVCILAIGVWGSRKSKKVEKKCTGTKSEISIVGGRNINVLVGIFTMTATWVGGGYIMGTAEAVYSPSQGLLWALGLPAYAISFFLGGLFFAKPMRSKRYVTMLDPFQNRYGKAFTATLLLPALVSDILWVACILAALGGTMSIILGLSSTISIIISAAVSILYTFLGGLYSVAYTDIIQLCFIFVSLWLCVPFLVLSPAVTVISQTPAFNQSQENAWLGHLELTDAGRWVDQLLLLVMQRFGHHISCHCGGAALSLHQTIISTVLSHHSFCPKVHAHRHTRSEHTHTHTPPYTESCHASSSTFLFISILPVKFSMSFPHRLRTTKGAHLWVQIRKAYILLNRLFS